MVLQIRTARLEMTAATHTLAEAELKDQGLFSRLLGATIPSVLRAFQGKGIATEMVNGISSWALAQTGVSRVEAEATPKNQSSRRVLFF